MLAICCSLAFQPAARAGGFLDKLNDVLKNLPKPTTQQHNSVAGTQASGTAATSAASTGGVSSIPIPPHSGTPEGTAAILKTIPSLSAGAFHLGMPRDEAIAKLRSAGMQAHLQRPQIAFKFEQLPNQSFIAGSSGRKEGEEYVDLDYTMYPNEPVVSAIQRATQYSPSNAPNVANTLAALRHKYGPESGTGKQNSLYWLFDYRGHPLAKTQIAQLAREGCLFSGPGFNSIYHTGIGEPEVLGRKISQGYAETNGGEANAGNLHHTTSPACLAAIRIDAIFQGIYKPRGGNLGWGDGGIVNKAADWAANSDNLVSGLTVTIKNVPLDYSASVVTRNVVLHGGEQQERQQIERAKQRKPSL